MNTGDDPPTDGFDLVRVPSHGQRRSCPKTAVTLSIAFKDIRFYIFSDFVTL